MECPKCKSNQFIKNGIVPQRSIPLRPEVILPGSPLDLWGGAVWTFGYVVSNGHIFYLLFYFFVQFTQRRKNYQLLNKFVETR